MWQRCMSNGARFRQATAGMNDVQRPGPELEVNPVDFTIDSDASSVNVIDMRGGEECRISMKRVINSAPLWCAKPYARQATCPHVRAHTA